ncbi:MAG: GDYXXLXY domain-containing protein [Pontiella sp.]
MKTFSMLTLITLAIVQFAVPYRMILGYERTLSQGELFRFKTRPIDPTDPFQGKYVRLRYHSVTIPCDPVRIHELEQKQPIYALLEQDDAGFARFFDWSSEKPESGAYYKTRYHYTNIKWNNTTKTHTTNGIKIEISFDRFYMDEAKAPRAERLAQDATRNSTCWANVRILEGKAIIEDVFAEGISLRKLAIEKDEKMALP